MAGSRKMGDDDNQRSMSEHEKEKLSLAETRKSLPIFKFRDALLEAINDHQVLIIEGKHFFNFLEFPLNATTLHGLLFYIFP